MLVELSCPVSGGYWGRRDQLGRLAAELAALAQGEPRALKGTQGGGLHQADCASRRPRLGLSLGRAALLEQRITACIAQYLAAKPLEAIDAVSRTELRGVLERELELPCDRQHEHFIKQWFKEVTLRLRAEAIARAQQAT